MPDEPSYPVPSNHNDDSDDRSLQKRFFDISEKRLELDMREVENNVEIARIDAETERRTTEYSAKDRAETREHNHKMLSTTLRYGLFTIVLVFAVIITLFAMGKDTAAQRVLELTITAGLFGGGGYAFGYGRGQKSSSSDDVPGGR